MSNPALSTRELKRTIRENLMQDPTLQKLVQGEVYGGHRKEHEDATMQKPLVVFSVIGGGSDHDHAPVGVRQIHLYGYSNRSLDEASQIYEAAANVLRCGGLKPRQKPGGEMCGTVCAHAQQVDAMVEGWNNNICAYFVRGTWRIWGISHH